MCDIGVSEVKAKMQDHNSGIIVIWDVRLTSDPGDPLQPERPGKPGSP